MLRITLLAALLLGAPGLAALAETPVPDRSAAQRVRNVAIVVHEGVELLDFAGPGEVFAAAGNGAFRVFTVAPTAGPVISQGFVKVVPDYSIADCPKPDIVVVPGGRTSVLYEDPKFMAWLTARGAEAELTMSVCNGALTLARTGLLDGLKATTHWGSVERLRQFPRITVVPGERFVDNGRIIATQGVSAGIDGALHVVQRLLGAEAAWSTAHYMMYPWEPAGLSPTARDELRPWIERDWPAVARVYGARLARDPGDAVAMARVGVAAEAQGDHRRAAETLDRAVASGAADAYAYDALGDAHMALGEFAAAARAYESELPLRSEPARPWIQLGIARAWSRAGRRDAAFTALAAVSGSGAIDRGTIERDPDLADLRGDPRFAEVLRGTK